jgi:hypothetical protein
MQLPPLGVPGRHPWPQEDADCVPSAGCCQRPRVLPSTHILAFRRAAIPQRVLVSLDTVTFTYTFHYFTAVR